MKFSLYRASKYECIGTIEINSLNELKQLNGKYNGKEDWAWDSHSIVIDFNLSEEEEEQGIEDTITIYDYYIE